MIRYLLNIYKYNHNIKNEYNIMNTHYNKDKNHFVITESLFYNKYFYIFYNVLFLILAIITNDYKRVFTAYFYIIFIFYT